jgi:hypothetical protein
MSLQGFEPITLKLADSTIHAQVGTTPNKPELVLLIGGTPRDYLYAKLGGWGSGGLGHL